MLFLVRSLRRVANKARTLYIGVLPPGLSWTRVVELAGNPPSLALVRSRWGGPRGWLEIRLARHRIITPRLLAPRCNHSVNSVLRTYLYTASQAVHTLLLRAILLHSRLRFFPPSRSGALFLVLPPFFTLLLLLLLHLLNPRFPLARFPRLQ
ncbi:hypothetical protein BSKO_08424 [Bryopsis sp. KO-2023]|nr:hypothetical protein BSKO_08424 [Bryopsis sp. KO-2023]